MKLGGSLQDQGSAVTKALDLSDGTTLWSYICLLKDEGGYQENHLETDCETSFKTLAGISSRPQAFLGFSKMIVCRPLLVKYVNLESKEKVTWQYWELASAPG